MFHLFTHAFFKALLFLSAGSVMHAMGDVIDMRQFGGLRKLLPTTHLTFLCGAAALAGVPLLSGFWSKDLILESLTAASESNNPLHRGLLRAVPGGVPHGVPDRVLHVPRVLPDVLGAGADPARSRAPRPRVAAVDDACR